MIREYTPSDIDAINEIGLLIKDNFKEIYKIEELNQEYAHIIVYESNSVIIGFLEYEEHFEITDIINIAVTSNQQNKGIASSLINHLINNTKANKLMLEVKENNKAALNLYKKCGFKEIHRRKKYYNDCDAIIMERMIS